MAMTNPATTAIATIAPTTRRVVLSDVDDAGVVGPADGPGVAAPALAAGADAAGDGLGTMLASVRRV